MNAAARILCSVGRRAHVSDLLRNHLHWLCMPQRIQFKLCPLMYKALHGIAPDYLRELCRSVNEDDARGSLWSAERGDLIVPRAATKFGDRAFAISGPLMWNSLLTTVRIFQHLVKLQICFEVSLVYLTIFSRLHQQLRSVTVPLNQFYVLWRHRNHRRIIIIILYTPSSNALHTDLTY